MPVQEQHSHHQQHCLSCFTDKGTNAPNPPEEPPLSITCKLWAQISDLGIGNPNCSQCSSTRDGANPPGPRSDLVAQSQLPRSHSDAAGPHMRITQLSSLHSHAQLQSSLSQGQHQLRFLMPFSPRSKSIQALPRAMGSTLQLAQLLISWDENRLFSSTSRKKKLYFHQRPLWEAETPSVEASQHWEAFPILPGLPWQLPFPLLKSSLKQNGDLHITAEPHLGMSPICIRGGCEQLRRDE